MKRITLIGKKVLAMALFSLYVSTAFAQINWPFDANETKTFANWFKQASTEAGKTNAEVLGIDIKRAGFSWDDMNTWANAEGKVFQGSPTAADGYVYTIWGGGFSKNAEFQGKLHYLYMSAKDKPANSPSAEVLAKLAGNVDLGATGCDVIQISGTSIETFKVKMTKSTASCYLNVRRNPKLKQVDISGSTGRLAELAIYANALEGEEGLIMDDLTIPEVGPYFSLSGERAGISNVDNNKFTFSTLPVRLDGSIFSGHALQYTQKNENGTIGMPIGTFVNGEYLVEVDEDIDLSSEYDIYGKITVFKWKDLDNEGEVLTDVATTDGFFAFDESYVGKTLVCEMTNAFAPKLQPLSTVPIRIVKEGGATGVENTVGSQIQITPTIVENNVMVTGEGIRCIKVLSLSGTLILKAENTNSLNLSVLSSGMYIIEVTTDGGIVTKKIIKK